MIVIEDLKVKNMSSLRASSVGLQNMQTSLWSSIY